MKPSKLDGVIGLIITGFVFPAVIINSLQFLGFAVVWTFWSHLFVFLDLVVFVLIVAGASKSAMQQLVSHYMKITQDAVKVSIKTKRRG